MQALVELARAGTSDAAPERTYAKTDAGVGEDAGERVAVSKPLDHPPVSRPVARTKRLTLTWMAIHRNFDKLLTIIGVRCPSIGRSC